MANVKVFADRQTNRRTGQKLYAPDLSIRGHKNGVRSFKNLLLKNRKAGKAQIYMKASYIVGIQVCSNHGPWGWDGATIGKYILKGYFFRTTGPEMLKLHECFLT
jgi:hypothetical protein